MKFKNWSRRGDSNQTLLDLGQVVAPAAMLRGQALSEEEVETLAMALCYQRWNAAGEITQALVEVLRQRAWGGRYGLAASFCELLTKMNGYGLVESFEAPSPEDPTRRLTDPHAVVAPVIRGGRPSAPSVTLKRTWDDTVDRNVKQRLRDRGVVVPDTADAA